MGERANLFDDGMERVHSAWDSVEDELGHIQHNIDKVRKQLEEGAEKSFEQLRQTALGKRIDTLRDEAQKLWTSNVESLVGLLPVPTQTEVKRLERRITQLSRKLNALEKAQAASTAAAAEQVTQTHQGVPVTAVESPETKQASA